MRFPRLAAALLTVSALSCYRSSPPTTRTDTEVAVERKTAVKPKDLSDTVKKGLSWLAKHQQKSGGWGQGDESSQMGGEMDGMRDTPNVADTSMALLAFLRAGYSGRAGDYQQTIARGVEYVVISIEKSDDSSLKVTDVTGTRVQSKIGQYADTFAALM